MKTKKKKAHLSLILLGFHDNDHFAVMIPTHLFTTITPIIASFSYNVMRIGLSYQGFHSAQILPLGRSWNYGSESDS